MKGAVCGVERLGKPVDADLGPGRRKRIQRLAACGRIASTVVEVVLRDRFTGGDAERATGPGDHSRASNETAIVGDIAAR